MILVLVLCQIIKSTKMFYFQELIYPQTLTVREDSKDIMLFPRMAVRRTIKSNCFLPHCYTNNTNTHSSSPNHSLNKKENKLCQCSQCFVGNYPVRAKPEFHCCIASIIRSIRVHVFKESSVLLLTRFAAQQIETGLTK